LGLLYLADLPGQPDLLDPASPADPAGLAGQLALCKNKSMGKEDKENKSMG